MRVEWAGQEFQLSANRAIYWPKRKTVIIADPHFGQNPSGGGKDVPGQLALLRSDLRRLSATLDQFASRRLVILGNFLDEHAPGNRPCVTAFAKWREELCKVEIILVRGNADSVLGDPPSEWNIECLQPPFFDSGLLFHHEAPGRPVGPVMAGHAHPSVPMRGCCGERVRVPCFWFREKIALVPAFGGWAESRIVRPHPGDAVVLVGPDELVRVA